MKSAHSVKTFETLDYPMIHVRGLPLLPGVEVPEDAFNGLYAARPKNLYEYTMKKSVARRLPFLSPNSTED
jgi:hypothetical protein